MKNDKLMMALAELDREFDKAALDWLISLYDPKSGGMYYAVSSRDNDEFEPDIESTTQTLSLLDHLGITYPDENGKYVMPEWFRDGVYQFLASRQCEEDGYFYDPVYRTTANKAKKERNTTFALSCMRWYMNGGAPYPTPMQRLSDDKVKKTTTDTDQSMYATRESYLSWLEEISATRDSYNWGSDISSGKSMIIATGHEEDTIEWLKKRQNKENGTWEPVFGMQAVNGVLKICGYFNKEPFPNYEIYARNVIEFTKSFEPGTAAAAWNPMGSLKVVVRTIGDSISPEIKRQLDDGIADMIINTTVQMRKFRQPDGGFSYGKRGSSTYSNDVKVSLGLPEGDVNAMALMSLIYNEAYDLSNTPKSEVWAKYRDYFWSEMKKKYDECH